jgi:hypothetical protein
MRLPCVFFASFWSFQNKAVILPNFIKNRVLMKDMVTNRLFPTQHVWREDLNCQKHSIIWQCRFIKDLCISKLDFL